VIADFDRGTAAAEFWPPIGDRAGRGVNAGSCVDFGFTTFGGLGFETLGGLGFETFGGLGFERCGGFGAETWAAPFPAWTSRGTTSSATMIQGVVNRINASPIAGG
jgi:hypothetical protein